MSKNIPLNFFETPEGELVKFFKTSEEELEDGLLLDTGYDIALVRLSTVSDFEMKCIGGVYYLYINFTPGSSANRQYTTVSGRDEGRMREIVDKLAAKRHLFATEFKNDRKLGISDNIGWNHVLDQPSEEETEPRRSSTPDYHPGCGE